MKGMFPRLEAIYDLNRKNDTRYGGATFTLSYLKEIVDAAVVSSEVATLEFSADMPLRMEFELPQGKLVYYVAPCIGA
jgi:DNA polymerase III sliding clamp (beta) subunit (PCNA family)